MPHQRASASYSRFWQVEQKLDSLIIEYPRRLKATYDQVTELCSEVRKLCVNITSNESPEQLEKLEALRIRLDAIEKTIAEVKQMPTDAQEMAERVEAFAQRHPTSRSVKVVQSMLKYTRNTYMAPGNRGHIKSDDLVNAWSAIEFIMASLELDQPTFFA